MPGKPTPTPRCCSTTWSDNAACTMLLKAAVGGEDGAKTKLDDIEIVSFATLLGGAGAETVAKRVSNAPVVFAGFSRAMAAVARRSRENPRRGRRTTALRAAVAVSDPAFVEDIELHTVECALALEQLLDFMSRYDAMLAVPLPEVTSQTTRRCGSDLARRCRSPSTDLYCCPQLTSR